MKRRLLILFVAILCFITVLATSFILDTLSLKQDLVAIEDFYGLFNDTLELRRYEKNLLYGLGADSYDQLKNYIGMVTKTSERLKENISRSLGADALNDFRKDLNIYRVLIDEGKTRGSFNVEAVRSRGQKLLSFTQKLLKKKRAQIHTALHTTTIVFILAMVGAFIIVLVLFYFQAGSVLNRLAILRKATSDVAEGKFSPIEIGPSAKDEITGLIEAFNRMATEIETKQEQLLQTRKLAAIGTFSSGIAHELNNPLNNISLTADTLKEEYASLSQGEALDLVEDIIQQADRASDVVKHLLDFCRETPPAVALLNMKQVLRATFRLIQNPLKLKSITLEDYVPDDLPQVYGDLHKLEQVFLNLFMNSIHSMEHGGLIYIEGKIDPPGFVRIDFSDTGQGIPAEALDHIFDPFYTTKPVGQGTGLGLSIVYGIIKNYGGYIEVKSRVKAGTTFSIFLPVAGAEKSEAENGAD